MEFGFMVSFSISVFVSSCIFGGFLKIFFFPSHLSDIIHSPLINLFVFFPQTDISNQLISIVLLFPSCFSSIISPHVK